MRYALMLTQPAEDFFSQLRPELQLQYGCSIDLLVAQSNEHAYELYETSWEQYDAFVFVGRVFMYSITKRVDELKRPCYCIDDAVGCIHDILLELLLENREIDLSRIYVDTATEQNNFLGLRELLPQNQWPYFSPEAELGPLNLVIGDAYSVTRAVLERHLQLYREGKIDFSITQFGAIVQQLKERELPHRYILPRREFVYHFFLQLMHTMADDGNNRVACIAARLRDKLRSPPLMGLLHRKANEYGEQHGYDFSIVQEGNTLCILTRYEDLLAMTEGLSNMGFLAHLQLEEDALFWGLGAGRTMFQAKRSANNALELSHQDREKVYYVSDENRVMGPLGTDSPVYERIPDQQILHLAKQYQVNHVNLQKIIAYSHLAAGAGITGEELAAYLGITLRSANRLLNKIAKAGGARISTESATGGKGRPKKYYVLTFLQEAGLCAADNENDNREGDPRAQAWGK